MKYKWREATLEEVILWSSGFSVRLRFAHLFYVLYESLHFLLQSKFHCRLLSTDFVAYCKLKVVLLFFLLILQHLVHNSVNRKHRNEMVRGGVWVWACTDFLILVFSDICVIQTNIIWCSHCFFSDFTASPIVDADLTDLLIHMDSKQEQCLRYISLWHWDGFHPCTALKCKFSITLKIHYILEKNIFGIFTITLSTLELIQNKYTAVVFSSQKWGVCVGI